MAKNTSPLLHDADNYRLNVVSLQETHLKEENFTSHTSPKVPGGALVSALFS